MTIPKFENLHDFMLTFLKELIISDFFLFESSESDLRSIESIIVGSQQNVLEQKS